MPRPKGIRANGEAINALIEEKRMMLKRVVDAPHQKTLSRARNGERVSEAFLQSLAQRLDVDVPEISISDDASKPAYRMVWLKFVKAESLKGFPRDFFGTQDFEQMDITIRPQVEARFDVDDPSSAQTEEAAKLVECVERFTDPLSASSMIRTRGQLNSAIKTLATLRVDLYVGSYKHRRGAWPFLDADQTETVRAVESVRLLLIFTDAKARRSVQHQVDLGMSLEGLREDEAWLEDLLERNRKGKLDEDETRYLDKLRAEAKQIFVDNSY